LSERQFQFEWDLVKDIANLRKHGVTFELAATIFVDPHLVSIPDLEHSDAEERWFSIGCASNGKMLSVVYLWWESGPETTRVRLISARSATRNEIRRYAIG
jgi:uncharacterized protein